MNRNLFLIASIFIGAIVITLAGNVIIIGDKLGQITHTYVEYAFYGALFLLTIIYIVHPVVKTHRSPEFPTLNINNEWESEELYTFGKKLTKNCNYITDKKERKKHITELKDKINFHSAEAENLKLIIRKEITRRLEGDEKNRVIGVEGRIKEWGKTVFMITAISQNGVFDAISVLIMNYKMISDIVLASGFRPTKPQLFKIYVRVLSTALITYCTSQVLTDVDSLSPFDFTDTDNIADGENIDITDIDTNDIGFGNSVLQNLKNVKIPGLLVGSTIQGCLNALLTMRIGYVVKTYLQEGPDSMKGIKNKRRVKRQAIKSSFKAMPAVVLAGGTAIGGKAANALAKLFNKGAEDEEI